jgi:hypothetical protein
MPASFSTTVILGLASALLMLTGVRFYPALLPLLLPFAPFPVVFATVRHHPLNGMGAAAVAALFVNLAAGSAAALSFFLFIGLPAWALGYVFATPRPFARFFPRTASPGLDSGVFYSFGQIAVLAAVATGPLTVLSILLASGSYGAYIATAHAAIEAYFRQELNLPSSAALVWPDGTSLSPAIGLLARLMPVFGGAVSMMLHLLNLWLAAFFASQQTRHSRPAPRLHRLALPRSAAFFLLAGLGLSFLPGDIHVLGSILAAGIVMCFILLGFCVLHACTLGARGRFFILSAVYFFVLFQGWPLILLALLGGADQLFHLRRRFSPPETHE